MLGDDIPAGSRIYRAVFLDADGKQTLSSYDAVKITFDNRLNAAEVREETYKVTLPADIREKITIQACPIQRPSPEGLVWKKQSPLKSPPQVKS